MTYEAKIVERWSPPSDFTIADITAIAKGALLRMTDPRTAIVGAALVYKAGIAAREKVASDGRTNLAVYTDGKFRVYISGAVNTGQALAFASDIATYPNHLAVANSGAGTASGAQIFAIAEENCVGGVLNVIQVRLVSGL